MHSLKRLSIQRIDHRSKVSILLIQANTKIHLSKEDRKILNELEKTLINSLTSIKLKIESNFYIW
jgi:ribosome biogenesis protein Tsr3